jgi:hypothetical protein
MQEIKLQPFNQEVLQKNTYKSSRNNHANPSCKPSFKKNTIECQKSPPSTSAPSLVQPITPIGRKNQTSLMSE